MAQAESLRDAAAKEAAKVSNIRSCWFVRWLCRVVLVFSLVTSDHAGLFAGYIGFCLFFSLVTSDHAGLFAGYVGLCLFFPWLHQIMLVCLLVTLGCPCLFPGYIRSC